MVIRMDNLKVNIIVVCIHGLGTSSWLKMQVEDIIQTHHLQAEVTQADVTIISTLEPHIVVGARHIVEALNTDHFPSTLFLPLDNLLDKHVIEKELLTLYTQVL